MEGGIFLTIKDLMKLNGSNCYSAMQREHQAIRDSLGKKAKLITIIEYCKYEEIDYEYVLECLRGKKGIK